jgi:hypothetical protein
MAHTPSPSDPAVSPPIIDPERFEDFSVFRETFLHFVSGAAANATLRAFGDLLYDLILEFWQYWPPQPEGAVQAGIRAAVADLRHVQGFLSKGPAASYETPLDAHLTRVGSEVALEVGKQADRLERDLSRRREEE